MPEPMYRLVYHSRNRVAGLAGASIQQILATSTRNNGRTNLTGALMFNSGYFVQALEGPRTPLEATFERIQRDERHGAITLMACNVVGERLFPDWAMAFVGPAADSFAAFEEIGAEGFDPARLSGEELLTTLHRQLLVGAFD